MIGDFLATDWPGAAALSILFIVLLFAYLIHRTTREEPK